MSDIVERLRFESGHGNFGLLMGEAAEEIERLTAALRAIDLPPEEIDTDAGFVEHAQTIARTALEGRT